MSYISNDDSGARNAAKMKYNFPLVHQAHDLCGVTGNVISPLRSRRMYRRRHRATGPPLRRCPKLSEVTYLLRVFYSAVSSDEAVYCRLTGSVLNGSCRKGAEMRRSSHIIPSTGVKGRLSELTGDMARDQPKLYQASDSGAGSAQLELPRGDVLCFHLLTTHILRNTSGRLWQ